jgi:pimeloyl-ACP methyl ester carboxylesterase
MKTTSNIAYYVQEGKGTPIVFLHGLCEDAGVWENFITAFAERHIIRIDLPGFGASEIYGNGSLRAMAEAVNKVLQKEQVKKSILIGHSMGGYVALEYAKKHGAEKLAGLGLFHSHPYEDTQERKDVRKKTIAHIDNYGTQTYIKQLFQSLATPDFTAANADLINALTEKALKISATSVANAIEAIRTRKDNSEMLKELACPVLFIVGEEDQISPKKMSLQQLILPMAADIHILPKVAHLGMFEAVETTQNIVNQFITHCEIEIGK